MFFCCFLVVGATLYAKRFLLVSNVFKTILLLLKFFWHCNSGSPDDVPSRLLCTQPEWALHQLSKMLRLVAEGRPCAQPNGAAGGRHPGR